MGHLQGPAVKSKGQWFDHGQSKWLQPLMLHERPAYVLYYSGQNGGESAQARGQHSTFVTQATPPENSIGRCRQTRLLQLRHKGSGAESCKDAKRLRGYGAQGRARASRFCSDIAVVECVDRCEFSHFGQYFSRATVHLWDAEGWLVH
jgi:hypothetical protein